MLDGTITEYPLWKMVMWGLVFSMLLFTCTWLIKCWLLLCFLFRQGHSRKLQWNSTCIPAKTVERRKFESRRCHGRSTDAISDITTCSWQICIVSLHPISHKLSVVMSHESNNFFHAYVCIQLTAWCICKESEAKTILPPNQYKMWLGILKSTSCQKT